MKKLFLVLSIVSYCFVGHAQVTKEQAISICAQEMAAFTKAVSGSYQKGMSYDKFQTTLCGKLVPTKEGANQLRVAYNFLTQGASNDFIIKNYRGREVADVLNYLQNAHKKGIESDGSEIFGGKTGTSNSGLAKNAGDECAWYQVWCHLQTFANWVVANWQTIAQIITFIMTMFP